MENNKKYAPEERSDRLAKLKYARECGESGYAGAFNRSHSLAEARELPEGCSIMAAGRLIRLRAMGSMIFGDLLDQSGRIQLVIRVADDSVSKEELVRIRSLLSIGDIIGVSGQRFTTQKGEVSILVHDVSLLSKALRPLPEKWHGLKDIEVKYRKRYLDLITDEETRERFLLRSKFIRLLREFYVSNDFVEIETPTLAVGASGALAKPFSTHYNALDLDVYLRVAPELYLKQTVIGGFERVFEIGKVFRNEGMDSSHLQEFTMLEHYAAYWDYTDNMRFTERMFESIIPQLTGSMTVQILNRNNKLVGVDFTPPYRVVTFRELLKEDCGIDINEHKTADDLRTAIVAAGIELEHISQLGRGNLIDTLYKKVSRPKLIQPTFLTAHPVDLSPLARQNDNDPTVVDRFQLVVNGWEVINAYSELADPLVQEKRFAQQMEARAHGDTDAMYKDGEFVVALEHGMPPTSGWGMGIDRMVALLTQQQNLRDVVLFPLLKP